jgi:hypothetical protein
VFFCPVDRSWKSRFSPTPPHIAPSKHVCYSFGHQYCTACDYISLIWMVDLRFDGVVGYRICLTHRRPPVRTRVEPFFFLPLQCSIPFHSGLRQHSHLHFISFFSSLDWRNENAPIKMALRSRVAFGRSERVTTSTASCPSDPSSIHQKCFFF